MVVEGNKRRETQLLFVLLVCGTMLRSVMAAAFVNRPSSTAMFQRLGSGVLPQSRRQLSQHYRRGRGDADRRRGGGKQQLSMWGEGPSDSKSSPSVPSSSPQQPRRQQQAEPRIVTDDEGRRVRGGRQASSPPSSSNNSWDDDDYKPKQARSSNTRSGDGGGGWDDFDSGTDGGYEPYQYSSNKKDTSNNAPPKGRRGGGGGGGGRRGGNRNDDYRERPQGRGGRRDGGDFDNKNGPRTLRGGPKSKQLTDEEKERKTNLKALEGAGFEHLYGLAPILNALGANRRDLAAPVEVDLDLLSPEEVELEEKQRSRKPEAQFAPYLFIQDQEKFHGGSRKAEKAKAAEDLIALATERGVPVAKVDKGVLNTLSGNRPHQGFALRCGSLFFEPLQFGGGIPLPAAGDTTIPQLWLVLDEVVDPQNFGALLRSAYFLGKQQQVTDDIEDGNGGIGILVCAKNSAPPSPVVSASSAGALELCQIHSTSNLPRTLGSAKEAGWRILGAAAKAPPGMVDDKTGEPTTCLDLEQVLSHEDGKLTPTMLVLGSEGHGLRTLVAKACTGFVRIPGSSTMDDDMDEEDGSSSTSVGVDSLNVSVTGGIMLWHLINGMKE